MKKVLLGCGSVIGLILIVGACFAAFGGMETEKDPVAESPSQSSTDENKDKDKEADKPSKSEDREITKEKYEQVKNGMSYDEVVKVIGFEGEEQSQSEVGEYKTVIYTWKNPDGSNMTATFQNGELTSKAQFGLK
ncbi:DUF3862 domain-containing protein [Melghirimyces algeriensis]|uniref:Beta-lactamase inhibitor (BLIP) n=1 Tax=Melghirimyces algeriensis TaxID=910412 RepID=A0A521AUN7_9BACL|nr:DUF3862 domain-containing protein [Melghirimyces algeriensis]SMO38524.1 protein of unknown function [Melghirimyces algeriensis]